MKDIKTLVEDMNEVIKGNGGWSGTISSIMGNNIAMTANQRFSKPQEPRSYLSLSSIGTPCKRKLWYKINQPTSADPLPANALLKFFFGDMIEELVLAIVKAAGHEVKGEQDRLDVHGIKGHRDCVIDGITVDVKSALPFAFKKFKDGNLREDDPFGYISQLSSYVYAGQDDPLVTNKTHGAFLVIDKVNGHICLDMYDFTEELKTKEEEMLAAMELVKGEIPEDRIPPVPQSKTSPNTKLDVSCSYCEFNKVCWPEARVFLYNTGPLYLVDVVNEPRVFELNRDEV
jgi:hypothetical protein